MVMEGEKVLLPLPLVLLQIPIKNVHYPCKLLALVSGFCTYYVELWCL